jgi:hypothetical protein
MAGEFGVWILVISVTQPRRVPKKWQSQRNRVVWQPPVQEILANLFPPQVPELLPSLVMKLLAKNAEERYQTASGWKPIFASAWRNGSC